MFVTVNETLTSLLEHFTPILDSQVGTWKNRCRSASKFPGQTYQAGCRVESTKLGSTGDVALLASNKGNWALVLRVYSGQDFEVQIDGKAASLPIMDPVSIFRSGEDECRDLLLAIASAYSADTDDGWGGPVEDEVVEEDGF